MLELLTHIKERGVVMSDKAVDVLNELIETCKDGEEGLRQAAASVKSSDLKSLFNSMAQERAAFAAELRQQVRSVGGSPEKSGSAVGAIHRAWIDIKGTLTGKSDHSILSEVERGEDSAVKVYKEALYKSLPAALVTTVNRQGQTIKSDHDRIRQLRDAKAATSGR